MPRGRPWRACKTCGQPRSFRGEFTRTGNCINCANELQRDATLQLVDHSGPVFEHWRRRCAASVGAVLLDDVSDTA